MRQPSAVVVGRRSLVRSAILIMPQGETSQSNANPQYGSGRTGAGWLGKYRVATHAAMNATVVAAPVIAYGSN